jgi:sugar/nucleoside kinase (ribokinase family)
VTDFLVSIANIFIDDIVTWQEEIHLAVTGGAGLHALAGCRVWHSSLGIIASAGEDVRPFLDELHAMGIDTAGIACDQPKTVRAWQVIQPDDVRVEVMRDPDIPITQAVPDFERLPAAYRQADGYHILWNGTDEQLLVTLRELRRLNPSTVIVLEPSPQDCLKPRGFFESLFPFLDGFSPSLSEARTILKMEEADAIIREFLDMGCRAIALRMGEQGSLAGDQRGQLYRVPAAEARLVDVTGAGNAYVGGWLCGLTAHKPMVEALAMASVSASFEIEQFGLCHFNAEKSSLRDSRLAAVLGGMSVEG